jgi:hypothetical protein
MLGFTIQNTLPNPSINIVIPKNVFASLSEYALALWVANNPPETVLNHV